MPPLPTHASNCRTCGTPLAGRYCHACGEQAFDPAHAFALRTFLGEAVEGFTSLDSRVLRTMWLLVARPGFLTAEFIAGRRVRYLRPLSLFLLSAVAFYLFNPRTTAFFANLGDLNRGYETGARIPNLLHVDTPALFARYVARAGLPGEEAWQQLVPIAAQASRTWLGLIAPAWGLLLWVAFRRRLPWMVPQVVFALHGLACFVVLDLAGIGVARLLGYRALGDRYVYVLLGLMTAWCILAVARVHRRALVGAIVPGLVTMAVFTTLLALYRQLVTIAVLATA